jgi:cellulose synthase/poly-beta-1,6-N-acetylglucosamine synthase-like glycosyltransferase
MPSLIAIVVPAHNEQRRIGQSMRAIERAALHPLLRHCAVLTVAVLDACEDDTDRRLRVARNRVPGPTLEVPYQNVGASRKAGIDFVLRHSRGLKSEEVWIATTDADTLVDRFWLLRQLRWWRRGAAAVAGTVRPYSPPDSGHRFTRYTDHMNRMGMDFGHPHVHGANMAFTAATYLEAGGIEPLPTAEDHALWSAMRATGRSVWAVGDVVVTTSARAEGRAPHGFAEFLQGFEAPLLDAAR